MRRLFSDWFLLQIGRAVDCGKMTIRSLDNEGIKVVLQRTDHLPRATHPSVDGCHSRAKSC